MLTFLAFVIIHLLVLTRLAGIQIHCGSGI